jgi:hypothetical protein
MFGEGGYYGDTECGSDDTQIQTRTTESGSGREIYPAKYFSYLFLSLNPFFLNLIKMKHFNV